MGKKKRRKGRCDNLRTRDIITRTPYSLLNVNKKVLPKQYPPDDIYKCIKKKDSFKQIQKFVFNGEQWKHFYFEVYGNSHGDQRSLRQLVMFDSILALLRGKYLVPTASKEEETVVEEEDGEEEDQKIQFLKVFLPKNKLIQSVRTTKLYPNDYEYSVTRKKNEDSGKIEVTSGDCLDNTLKLIEIGYNPAMLIMCSRTHPGGKYEVAPKSQEETICRRSTLFMCLGDPYRFDSDRKWTYPHPEYGSLYVPKCIVFRESEDEGYSYLRKPINVSMMTQYCYAHPPVEKNLDTGEFEIKGKSLLRKYKKKIDVMFKVALENGHDSVVLSAFGCGVYENPPRQIARLFKEVIKENKYLECFKLINFSILGESKSGKGGENLRCFKEELYD